MKLFHLQSILIALFIGFMGAGNSLATSISITIAGTYADSLTDREGNSLFEDGDIFEIKLLIDDSSQPEGENSTGSFIYEDISMEYPGSLSFVYDYSKIISSTYKGLSLYDIDMNYPSDSSATDSEDLKTGSFLLEYTLDYTLYGVTLETLLFEDSLNYTTLYVNNDNDVLSGYIYYNYRMMIYQQGPSTVVRATHDSIALNISSFDVQSSQPTAVPEPATFLLFAVGFLGIPIAGKNAVSRLLKNN